MKKIVLLISLFLLTTGLNAQNFPITWQNCFGGNQGDVATDIIYFNNGYYIVGESASADSFISIGHGKSDGWLIRTNQRGQLLWEKRFGGSFADGFLKIVLSSDSSYLYLIGLAHSSDGDISFDPYPESVDLWIVKTDTLGNKIWDKILGGNMAEEYPSGTATRDGGLVVICTSHSYDGDISVWYGMKEAWAVKLDKEGHKQWDYTIGTDWLDTGDYVIQTHDGGYLFATSSMNAGGIGNITCIPHTYHFYEVILTKTDSNLNVQWQRCYGGSANDLAKKIIELNDGYLMINSTASYDGDITGFHGDRDGWIVKVDFEGNIRWQKSIGGSANDYLITAYLTKEGNIIAVGNTNSNDGDVSGNHSLQVLTYSRNDLWLVKLSGTDGELLFSKCYGGIDDEQMGGIAMRDGQHFVIASSFFYGPSFDIGCSNHGLMDWDSWIFEVVDCDGIHLTAPMRPVGPLVVCTQDSPFSIYSIRAVPQTDGYEWSLNPLEAGNISGGDTMVVVQWASGFEGTATLLVRAVHTCVTSGFSPPLYIEVHPCTGLSESGQSGIKVWPNPAGRRFYVLLPGEVRLPARLVVYRSTGEKVREEVLGEASTSIEVRQMASGLYFWSISFPGGTARGKILINKGISEVEP